MKRKNDKNIQKSNYPLKNWKYWNFRKSRKKKDISSMKRVLFNVCIKYILLRRALYKNPRNMYVCLLFHVYCKSVYKIVRKSIRNKKFCKVEY